MRTSDIMTRCVVTVAADTPVAQIASLLVERGISAVPVVERDRVTGIVSEEDLLHRHEIGTDSLLEAPGEYVRSHGLHAADVMSSPVVSVTEDTPLARVADLMEKRRIKRIPVLRHGRLVGIVSRSDLVKALAASMPASGGDSDASSDEDLRRRLLRELLPRPWWHACSSAIVRDGVAELWGVYEDAGSRAAARVAVENVHGLRGLEDHRIALASLPRMV